MSFGVKVHDGNKVQTKWLIVKSILYINPEVEKVVIITARP